MLYIREEEGRYYVEYNGKIGATNMVARMVGEIIDEVIVTRFRVSFQDTVTRLDGKTFNLSEKGGGNTIPFDLGAPNNALDRIQIFVSVNADSITNKLVKANNILGDDGKLFVGSNIGAVAHEFGHAWTLIRMKNAGPSNILNSGLRKALQDGISVGAENLVRERLGLNKRKSHDY